MEDFSINMEEENKFVKEATLNLERETASGMLHEGSRDFIVSSELNIVRRRIISNFIFNVFCNLSGFDILIKELSENEISFDIVCRPDCIYSIDEIISILTETPYFYENNHSKFAISFEQNSHPERYPDNYIKKYNVKFKYNFREEKYENE